MRVPTTYYAPDSGIGLALGACCAGRARNVGVVGLGAGTIAAYGRAGDRMRFYEINPAVRPIAENLFAYLKGSPAEIAFAEGDARASLAAEPAQGFDVMAIDAFSGDAIPLHLLTVQALAVYRRHLAPGGVLAFHVSNQYVDLAPELAALAAASGMTARNVGSHENKATGELAADWVLMTADASFFARDGLAGRAFPIEARRGVKVWTDDYSSLLPLVRW
jgi:spermidine synthase